MVFSGVIDEHEENRGITDKAVAGVRPPGQTRKGGFQPMDRAISTKAAEPACEHLDLIKRLARLSAPFIGVRCTSAGIHSRAITSLPPLYEQCPACTHVTPLMIGAKQMQSGAGREMLQTIEREV
ncbi:MAG TPA: hypothetical protein VH186_01205 [Chloroflexia bacterium]|nr:hypothetical protein [Chloroflexia bacterium]